MSHVFAKLMYCAAKTNGGVGPAVALMPIPVGAAVNVGTSEAKVSSGVNQRTTLAPTAALCRALNLPEDPTYLVWYIKNCGDYDANGVVTANHVAVNIKIDGTATPTATASPAAMTDCLLPTQYTTLHCTAFGETVALIEADVTE